MTQDDDAGADDEVSITDLEADAAVRDATSGRLGDYVPITTQVVELPGAQTEPCAFCNAADLVAARGEEMADYGLAVGDWESDDEFDHQLHTVPICGTCLFKRPTVAGPGEVTTTFTDFDEETRELMDEIGDIKSTEEMMREVLEEIDDPEERAEFKRFHDLDE
ncbi:hypothetical protein [Haloarcula salinisoli]|uniref:Uncharacterized protein n=1 Tax=Haloarcula salinisoli TaxID=2487746 RepID=A0A8J7YHF0_9EURY|nr:hypothetical protein [Halomicroarcula salinisoli]MBX0288615.1 hypothetical protein [Halomicroarcula salinisoli]MBX0306005.1 hypothetical protein [Halomicroarcula salinisoli]